MEEAIINGKKITSLSELFFEYTELKNKYEKLEKELEPFKDEYFKDLDNCTIAGLAKKSIRITTIDRELVHKFEEIKNLIKNEDFFGRNFQYDREIAYPIINKINEVIDVD